MQQADKDEFSQVAYHRLGATDASWLLQIMQHQQMWDGLPGLR